MEPRIKLALVDDDPAFLFELSQRVQAQGFAVRSFREAATLLHAIERGADFDCIVADVRMPGMSGLELHGKLAERSHLTPLILFTGYADIDIAVSAVKAGAWDFMGKPIDEGRLKTSIQTAVSAARQRAKDKNDYALVASRVAELSERHRQVLDLMVKGLTSKQIASALTINHRTVENYRAAVMEKLGVSNVAQLVRAMIQLEAGRNSHRR